PPAETLVTEQAVGADGGPMIGPQRPSIVAQPRTSPVSAHVAGAGGVNDQVVVVTQPSTVLAAVSDAVGVKEATETAVGPLAAAVAVPDATTVQPLSTRRETGRPAQAAGKVTCTEVAGDADAVAAAVPGHECVPLDVVMPALATPSCAAAAAKPRRVRCPAPRAVIRARPSRPRRSTSSGSRRTPGW